MGYLTTYMCDCCGASEERGNGESGSIGIRTPRLYKLEGRLVVCTDKEGACWQKYEARVQDTEEINRIFSAYLKGKPIFWADAQRLDYELDDREHELEQREIDLKIAEANILKDGLGWILFGASFVLNLAAGAYVLW